LERIVPQPEQAAEWAAITAEQARASELSGEGWSIFVGLHPVACAVLSEISDGRAAIWAILSVDAGPHMLRALRVSRRMFEQSNFRRIEAVVLTGFAAGDRWMRILGFQLETPHGMAAFGPNGEAYSLYARVK
jgi:hypothetical protein